MSTPSLSLGSRFSTALGPSALVGVVFALLGLAVIFGLNARETMLYMPWMRTSTAQVTVVGHRVQKLDHDKAYYLQVSYRPDGHQPPIVVERNVDEELYQAALHGQPVTFRFPIDHPDGGYPDDPAAVGRLLLLGATFGLVSFLVMLWVKVVHGGLDNVSEHV